MISIVIPNYNGLEHLETCFRSIFTQTFGRIKVVLVDNGSSDNSVKYTRDNFRDVEIITLNYNSGFAKAVNIGLKHCLRNHKSPFLMLLNNDTELEKEFINKAISTFESQPDAHSLAVKMLNFYNRDIIDDTGNFITRKGGTAYPRGNGQKDVGQYDETDYIFGACAGAAIYKKEVFDKIGFFDEDFFAYLEDIDFNFRAQLAGLKCYYQPEAVCFHKRGASKISTMKFQIKLNERNAILLRIKNYPFIMYLKYQPRFFLSRLYRYYLLFKHHGTGVLLAAIKGYISGSLLLVFQLKKRFKIQSMKTVSNEYIESLFR